MGLWTPKIFPQNLTLKLSGIIMYENQTNQVAHVNNDTDDIKMFQFGTTNWAQVGNPLALPPTTIRAVTAIDNNTAAVAQGSQQSLTAYTFDGLNWTQKGNALNYSGPGGTATSLAATRRNQTALFVQSPTNTLRMFEFDGSNWAQVGNQLDLSTINASAQSVFAAVTKNHIAAAIQEGALYKLYMITWDGTDFNIVGNPLTITGSNSVRSGLCRLAYNTVAFYNNGLQSLQSYRYVGPDWKKISNDLTGLSSSRRLLQQLNSNRIAVLRDANDVLQTYNYQQINSPSFAPVGPGDNVGPASFSEIASMKLPPF